MSNQDSENQQQYEEEPIEEQNLNYNSFALLDDEQSPFHQAPPLVQDLIQSCIDGDALFFDNLDIHLLGFEIKKTKNNFCSFYVREKQQRQFYTCMTCTILPSTCICVECFDLKKHIGHDYVKQLLNYDSFCDCGRVEAFEKQCFCNKHSNFDTQIECEIPQEKQKLFIDSITSLIQCCCYLRSINQNSMPLLTIISKYLCHLNQSSVYYNRITMKIISKISKHLYKNNDDPKQGYYKRIFTLLLISPYGKQLTIHMNGDLRTRKNMVKLICDMVRVKGQKQFLKYNLVNIDELFNVTVSDQLIDQNFHDGFFAYSLITGLGQITNFSPLAKKVYIKKFTKEIETQNITFLYQTKDVNKFTQLKQASIKRAFQIYPFDKAKQFIPPNLLLSNYTLHTNLVDILKSYNNGLFLGNKLILKCLLNIASLKPSMLINLREYLINLGITQTKIDDFLECCILQVCHQLLYIDPKEQDQTIVDLLVPLFALINGSPKERNFTDKFWNLILQTHNVETFLKNKNSLLSFSQIHSHVDHIFFVINSLIKSDTICLLVRKRNSNDEQIEEVDDDLALFLKCYLYAKKQITMKDIFDLKAQNLLDFDDATKLLSDYCTYDPKAQTYKYKSLENYPNTCQKFIGIHGLREWRTIYNFQLKFGQTVYLDNNPVAKCLIKTAFQTQIFTKLLDDQWQRYLRSSFKNDGKHFYGFLYLLGLLLTYTFSNVKDQQLTQRFLMMSKNPQTFQQFTTSKKEIIKIQALFTQKQIINPQSQPEIQPQPKPNIIIDQEQSQQQTELNLICSICQQQSSPQNIQNLVYFSFCTKKTTSSAIFSNNCVTSTFLSTCFHCVHFECLYAFQQTGTNNHQCPSCQKIGNCFIPIQYNPQNEQLNQTCYNSMMMGISGISGQITDEGIFQLILKHLIESSSLTPIILQKRNKKSKALQKSDKFLFETILSIYTKSSSSQKQQYKQIIQNILKTITNLNTNQPIKYIQIIFTQLYKSLITQQPINYDINIIYKIYDKLNQNQFWIFKKQFFKLTHFQIHIPNRMKQNIENTYHHLIFLQSNCKQCSSYYQGIQCQNNDQQVGVIVCLICGALHCRNCYANHFKTSHNNIILCLDLTNFRMVISKNEIISVNIYQDNFHVSVQMALQKNPKCNLNEYFINYDKYDEIVNRFFQDGDHLLF